MRKLVIVLIVLVVIAALAAVALFNLDRIVNSRRDYFISKAESSTGRRIEVGEIGASIWGGLAVRLDDVKIADDPAFSSGDCIEAEQLRVNVALFPLLKKELKVKKVILKKPNIVVMRNAEGRFNFESLGRTGGGQPAEAGSTAAPTGPAATVQPAYMLFVAAANIDDGRVRFVDSQDNSELHLDGINLSVKDLQMDKPVGIELSAVLLPEPETEGRSNVKLAGKIGPIGETPVPETIPVELSLSIDPLSLGQAARIPLLAGRLPAGLTAQGPVKIEARLAGTAGEMTATGSIDLSSARIELKDLFAKSDKVPLRMEADLKKSGEKVQVERLLARLHNLELSGSGEMTLGEKPSIELSLKSNPADLAGWEAILPALQPAAPAGGGVGRMPAGLVAEGPVRMEARLSGTAEDMAVKGSIDLSSAHIELKDRFDKTDKVPLRVEADLKKHGEKVSVDLLLVRFYDLELSGTGEMTLGETPRITLDLKSNPADLAGWETILPALQPAAPGSGGAGRMPAGLVATGPVQLEARLSGTIENMAVNGSIDLSSARIELKDRFAKSNKVPFRAEADLKKSGEKVQVERLLARLHNLELSGSGEMTLGETPRANLKLKSNSVDLAGWAAILPTLGRYDPAGRVEMNVQIDGDVAPGMLPPSRGRAALHRLRVKLPHSPRPLENLEGFLLFHSQAKELLVDSLNLAGLDGTITGNGRLELGEAKPSFLLDARLRGLDLTRLLVATPAGSTTHFEGRLDMDFLAGGQGAEWKDISQSLEGDGRLAVKEGTILKFNLAQYILGSISNLIGSQPLISDRLAQAYPKVFKVNQTSFKTVESSLAVQNGRVYLPDAEMATGDYTISGQTNLQLDGVLESRGVLVLSDRLTADVVKEFQYVSVLKNSAGRLEIPFTISGKLPKVKVEANLDAKKIQESLIKPEVDKLKNKLLKKLFDKK